MGRLLGTLLSGILYQWCGLNLCHGPLQGTHLEQVPKGEGVQVERMVTREVLQREVGCQ